MTEPINMLDDEYCTPAQRAELRRMREELPLWQETNELRSSTAAAHEVTVHVDRASDSLESTIDATQVQMDVRTSTG